MRRTSSRRARTCASSPSRGEFRRSASRCFRTRRRCCRSCGRATSFARELGLDGPTLAFAGRLTAQKSLDVALVAVARERRRDVPRRRRRRPARAARGARRRARPLPRRRCRARGCSSSSRAADASLLSSAWENFPHTVVEALAVGTPVIATAVGGVPEVVHDGENGLLVPAGRRGRARRRDPPLLLRRGAADAPAGRRRGVRRARTRRSGSSSSSSALLAEAARR